MKIFFPLSLKVSLWLLLNLVLVAGVGGAFLVKESGFGWDMLVAASPADKRLKDVARELTLELRQTPADGRDEMLARLGEEYDVKLFLFQNADAVQLAGPRTELPPEVRERFEQPRGFGPGFRGQGTPSAGGNPGFGPGFAPPGGGQRADGRRGGPPPSENESVAVGGAGGARGQPGLPLPQAAGPVRAAQQTFLQRTGGPAAYWVGVRLQPVVDRAVGILPITRVPPATLLMRADSLWAAMHLLDLDPWLVAAAAAMGLSVLFWLPLVRGITYALGQLTRATEQIAEGRFDTRVEEQRRDEIGRLGSAVNVMAAQLDRAATGQKRFLGDIAHELGSPVGRMQVAVGILEEQAGPALQPAVADVREEVQQMSELVGELLAFTKAGLRARDAALVRVELVPLAADVLAREAAQGKIIVNVPAGLAVAADAALLTRSLANLVRNALRYAGDAGPVTLTAQTDGAEVVIAVEDCGPGVPAGTLTRLGEPFYRPEFARTRDTGGAGLGLAIVKSAAEACRGTVRFTNRDPHGFRAEVRLAAA